MGSITNYSFYPFLLRQFKVKEHFSPFWLGKFWGKVGKVHFLPLFVGSDLRQTTFFTPFGWVSLEANHILTPFGWVSCVVVVVVNIAVQDLSNYFSLVRSTSKIMRRRIDPQVHLVARCEFLSARK